MFRKLAGIIIVATLCMFLTIPVQKLQEILPHPALIRSR